MKTAAGKKHVMGRAAIAPKRMKFFIDEFCTVAEVENSDPVYIKKNNWGFLLINLPQ